MSLGNATCPRSWNGDYVIMECAARSLDLDARRLDYRPPFLDLGLLQCAERFRRLLLPREYLLPKVAEPPTHVCFAECIDGRGIKLGDDALRRILRHPKTVP